MIYLHLYVIFSAVFVYPLLYANPSYSATRIYMYCIDTSLGVFRLCVRISIAV
jgi:hypothetical protein